MILRIFTISLEPENPLRFSVGEFRTFLNKKITAYSAIPQNNTAGFIHRYPPLQCKQLKGDLIAIGLNQGADCLYQIAHDKAIQGTGESTCRITASDMVIRPETFGIADTVFMYEFLTPWLALNQQHAKKFYELKGKLQRDVFMQNLLTSQLTSLAKSLDYNKISQICCKAKVRFRRERIDRENVMVFLGKFRTNLCIPDYLGIGRSVSQGYGTIKRITESPDMYSGES